MEVSIQRVAISIGIAIAAHVAVLVIRSVTRRALHVTHFSQVKIQTLTGFAASVAVFAAYFAAAGFVLREFGISATAYLASASVIGLAVSFGSQGIVQDVVSGLTNVFADLVDVGDLVEISGNVGIVQRVGIRFTTLVGFNGSLIAVPNRSITNVISYPDGYVRVFVDVTLPDKEVDADRAEVAVRRLVDAAYDQFPGVMLREAEVVGRRATPSGAFLRIKCRIWPGQGAMIETILKPRIVRAVGQIVPDSGDWMVAVHYRSEPWDSTANTRLPRPAVLRNADRDREQSGS